MARLSFFSLGAAILMLVLQQPNGLADEAKIAKLLENRRDVLRRVVQLHEMAYRNGAGTLGELIAAKRELVEAELEFCKMADERIELRKAVVKFAKDYEAMAKKRFEVGDMQEVEVLRATTMRLRAEVELLREIAAAKPAD